MTREEAHDLVDKLFDNEMSLQPSEGTVVFAPPERKLPEGQRVVRTKTSGDRVYLLDEIKKTRQWITNGEVLTGLGFEMSDVTEVSDIEMMKFNMGPALYKAPDAA